MHTMKKPKKILIVTDLTYKPIKMFLNQMPKLSKGFIRLGHDARIFSYGDALRQLSSFKSRTLTKSLYKSKVDKLLVTQIENYKPDIIYLDFIRVLNAETVVLMRQAAPDAVFIASDGDPWPELHKERIEIAKKLDIITATNDGEFLQVYKNAGVPLCTFMPNLCDPDTDHRYEVEEKWKTDILWTGTTKHRLDPSESFREELVNKLAQRENCTVYGCLGRGKIAGINYLYAISGARIGVSVNATNSVRLYHSDRLTHYLACGTFVLAKKEPDTNLPYEDGQHLKYYDEIDEFLD